MTSAIMTVNAGSSSLKFALFDSASPSLAILRGEVSDLSGAPHLIAHDGEGNVLIDQQWRDSDDGDFTFVLKTLLEFIDAHSGHDELAAVGHRVVHGGADHIAPEFVTPSLLQSLTAMTALDPIHMPHSLAPIHAIGVAKPMNVTVYTEGTGRISDERIAALIHEYFDLRPKGIIQMLDLLRPIYQKTAAYGHFGREEPEFTWERTDKAQALRAAAGL